jgi:hypothetical protein
VQELERTVAIGRHERSQLLKHVIAKEDELDALRQELTALRTEHEKVVSQNVSREHATSTSRRPAARAAMILAGFAAVSAASIGLFDAAVARPARARLAMESAQLNAQLQEAMTTSERLRADLAAKGPPSGPTGPPTEPAKPPVDLSAEKKSLAERQAAVDQEGRRLAQLRRDLDAERQILIERKKALDDDRAALQKRAAALTQSAAAGIPDGVLVWRADVTVPAAVIIIGNKANFGTVSGAMPARPAVMRLVPFEGEVKAIDVPGPKNNWNRLYLQVLGKGRVTVFLLWVAR